MTEQLTSTVRSQFRGDLSQFPLPEMLVAIHHYRAPGVIECCRDEETKRIHIDDGNIVFATSGSLRDSLGDQLLRAGRITQVQYDESVRRIKEDRTKRQGAVLVELGALAPRELFIAVRDQIQSIVWSIFEWESGSVCYEPGREKQEPIKLNIPSRQVVLAGVRRLSDGKVLIARIGTKTTILQPVDGADFSELTLLPHEIELMAQIDGRRTLFELTKTPPLTPAENAKALYAFFALRLISVRESRQIKVQVKAPRGG